MVTRKSIARTRRVPRARPKASKSGTVPKRDASKKASKKVVRRPVARDVGAAERVVAELAHDIRTPLTGIIALSELLAGANLGERERQWVAALRNSADHLASLTTLTVDAARRNASDLPLRREPFDLRVMVEAVAIALTARAQEAGLQCKTEIAADLPQVAIGDAVRLRAALENLIDNAVKFTLRGSVGLTVTAEPSARDTRLTFDVSDSGIGLTPAEIKRLFKPFAQAHDDIARRFGGAGLGLSLVKRMARAMKGNLGVTSTPGRGSTFRLIVKVGRQAPSAPDQT